eukprot:TRINITY_DN3948_c0_g1_i1.p1 TRINITY_DN3948_c0_g1~~TRINITY_DN3948_c0_g1_i1.p1  ORF type:complete len:463 (+),score=84.50 TRINITY_DN3948_c0_g1_i1:184-1572(+)
MTEKRLSFPRVEALYDFRGEDEAELQFKKGDVFLWRGNDTSGWSEGEFDGRVGWFPASYVKFVDIIPTVLAKSSEEEKKGASVESAPVLEQQSIAVNARERDILKSEISNVEGRPSESISTSEENGKMSLPSSPLAAIRHGSETVQNGRNRSITLTYTLKRDINSPRPLQTGGNRPASKSLIGPRKPDNDNDKKHEPLVDKESINKRRTKDLLQMFIHQRPTVEQLQLRNIISDEAKKKKDRSMKAKILTQLFKGRSAKVSEIFGVELDVLLQRDIDNGMVPMFQQCIAFLKANGLEEEGLFRVSGSFSDIEHLRKAFESGKNLEITDTSVGVHAVSSLLKKFLRELPEPLIPFQRQSSFLKALECEEREEKLSGILELVKGLPAAHHSILVYLISFLNTLSQKSEINKMGPANIGICFGPTIMREPEDKISMNNNERCELIQFLVVNYAALFRSNSAEASE